MSHEQKIGTCVLLLNSKGEVLVGKRKNAYLSGYYGLPGGRIEVNEPLLASAIREVEEETGIRLSDLEYVGVVRENQSDYDFVHFAFVAKKITTKPQCMEPHKCESWEWKELDKVEHMLPGHKASLELFKEKKNLVDLTN